ncbi:MAG: hypothetical protein LBM65_02075 [Oscillospiraceae bacterium]|jgi:hypothetical protein|nr:hypothetical protein [Oscillospiraceae bacterium]
MPKPDLNKIKHRAPYGAPIINDYAVKALIDKPESIERKIDARIAKLQKQGINLSECPDYLESIITEYIAEMKTKLQSNHISNLRFLDRIFIRRATDKKDFEELEKAIEIEIASTEVELKEIKKLYEECNPLYKGRLNSEGNSRGNPESIEYIELER